MRVICLVTTREMSQIIKGKYAKSSCHCGACTTHLSFEEEQELAALGKYSFATVQKLRKQGDDVVYVVQKQLGMPVKTITCDRFSQMANP